MRIRRDVYLNTPATGLVHAADCVVEEIDGVIERVAFRYRTAYLDRPGAFSIDPVALSLSGGQTVLRCQGGVPGFLDDYLPDDWGRKVMARAAFFAGDTAFDPNRVTHLLERVSHSHIGALSLTTPGEAPRFEYGVACEALGRVEEAAALADGAESQRAPDDADSRHGLLQGLAQAASSVGGARPKALVFDGQGRYLAKFNRRRGDAYNNARVELACLEMARAAGLEVARGRVVTGTAGRDILLLERFDVAGDARHHLVSVNALLKDRRSQRDRGRAFRYDDIAELVRRHSTRVRVDMPALVRLMTFNRAINNTDDHERNFSLIHRGEGYCLSPAYDLTPSLAIGEYHAAGFGYEPSPPSPRALTTGGRVFGLGKPEVRRCAEEVMAVIGRWSEFAEQAGVDEEEAARVARCFSA